jgi:hypothetical protein
MGDVFRFFKRVKPPLIRFYEFFHTHHTEQMAVKNISMQLVKVVLS